MLFQSKSLLTCTRGLMLSGVLRGPTSYLDVIRGPTRSGLSLLMGHLLFYPLVTLSPMIPTYVPFFFPLVLLKYCI